MGQLYESLDAQLEIQRQEINYIIQLQSERLKWAFQKETRMKLASLLTTIESRAMNLMRQKEYDLELSWAKSMELEAQLKMLETEKESWQRICVQNEVVIAQLHNALETLMVRNRAQDEESSSSSSSCEENKSWFVSLPCRHVCHCKPCEALLTYCPVCRSVRDASLQVFLV